MTATKAGLQKDDIIVYDRQGGTIDVLRNGEPLHWDDKPAKYYIGIVDDFTAEKFIAFIATLSGLKADTTVYGRSTISSRLVE